MGLNPTEAPVPLKQQLACAKRDLDRRERVYPGLVKRKVFNQHVAAHEIRAMSAIVATLEKLVGLEETTDAMLAKAEKRANDLLAGVEEP